MRIRNLRPKCHKLFRKSKNFPIATPPNQKLTLSFLQACAGTIEF